MIEEASFAEMVAIEAVSVYPDMNEGIVRGHAGNATREEGPMLDRLDAQVESVDEMVFAREVVVDDARASSGALGEHRHRCVMEAALDDEVEHGLEDRFALVGLCWDCQVS